MPPNRLTIIGFCRVVILSMDVSNVVCCGVEVDNFLLHDIVACGVEARVV